VKILATSYAYAPSVGGIETVTDLLAHGFAERGHEVRIVTHTAETDPTGDDFPVFRRPSPTELWKATSWADVVWQNNIALHYLWAPLLQRKPAAVTLACAVFPDFPKKDWRVRLKAALLKRCHVFAISRYVLKGLDVDYDLVGNPFDAGFAGDGRALPRDRDIVFLGRLVSDKGADLLLEALADLKNEALVPTCTIIGDGPERAKLEGMAAELQLGKQVRFTGYLRGEALYGELSRHRIMAVPSRWNEPFGVVALEGIAAGCAVAGSSGGGLPDAIGPCGLTFANNDRKALADALGSLLREPEQIRRCREQAPTHLERFSVDAVTERYLSAFRKLTGKSDL